VNLSVSQRSAVNRDAAQVRCQVGNYACKATATDAGCEEVPYRPLCCDFAVSMKCDCCEVRACWCDFLKRADCLR
jgi:hypothetical protein